MKKCSKCNASEVEKGARWCKLCKNIYNKELREKKNKEFTLLDSNAKIKCSNCKCVKDKNGFTKSGYQINRCKLCNNTSKQKLEMKEKGL